MQFYFNETTLMLFHHVKIDIPSGDIGMLTQIEFVIGMLFNMNMVIMYKMNIIFLKVLVGPIHIII